VTVTGCLQKGDEPGEYAITGEDGKSYGLRGKNVDFSKHLGHKVAVTGIKMHHENEAKENGAKEEDMHLNVSSLKHISDTCQ